MSDDLLSISAPARRVGIAPSTLSRQVASGQVRSHDGKRVRLDEVIADRKANIADPVGGHRRSPDAPVPTDIIVDTDPASPAHYTPSGAVFNDELIQKLAVLLDCDGDDYFDVGVDCIFVGMELMKDKKDR
jgi:hypothetical protein